MFIIIEGEFSDWEVKGYVETEREALDVCADHNAKEDNYYDQWYFEEVNPIGYCHTRYESGFGMYEYHVVFHPDKSFESARRFSIFPTVRKEPKIVQEDQYCYVVRVTANGEEKAMKIAKDFLMQTLAERAGIC